MLVTRSRLAHELDELGLRPGGAAMVHCRMSSLGHVVGGAESVVCALLDALGPKVRSWPTRDGRTRRPTPWTRRRGDEATRRAYLEEHPAYDPRVALSRRDHGRAQRR